MCFYQLNCQFIFQAIAEPQFVPQDTLRAWQEKNHPWLELSDVHKQTTENIRVTVIPFYMGYRENQGQNVYWVKIDELTDFFSFRQKVSLD